MKNLKKYFSIALSILIPVICTATPAFAKSAVDGDYKDSVTKTFKIIKGVNPVTVTVKKSAAAKSRSTVSIKKAVKVKKAEGKVTYKTNNKKVTVKKGTMLISKGLKKGKTYKVKIIVTAKGNSNYKAKTITKIIKIKVK